MHIRIEQDRDRPAVREVQRTAFGGAHGDTVARLVDALRNDDPSVLSLVAERDDEVAGHVMFSRALVDAPRRLVRVRTLSPLAVAPARQRTGIGVALIREGLRRLDELGVPLVFLEGDPAYYSRSGFEPAREHGFRKPSLRIPDAGFQVVRLSAYEPWMTGTFVYADTFWEHDCVGLREPEPEVTASTSTSGR
ncbi:N-acetyltransferase [Actinoplanes sichuanensis]|uniref:GNAT family N-acetyltransferase n=1 Tax=Actinoplanes sichuanensis TaxID=512349 RepID=A0ABW4ABF3_9ACTN|nr:N-acetyltransferase [Actinoplanes sichuanensis]BEL05393.1 N-acetyltransferase [Actinoplanes sichuanensis]